MMSRAAERAHDAGRPCPGRRSAPRTPEARRRRVANVASAIALLVSCASGGASAQEVASEYFRRDRSVSVSERGQPAYQASGVRVGSFNLSPQLTASTSYDDNIYASRANEEEDWVFQIQPEARLQSGWARHSLRLHGIVDARRYADNDSENATDWQVDGGARLDTSRANRIDLDALIGRRTQERTSPESAAFTTEPIRYLFKQAGLQGEHEFNRLKFTARGIWQDYDYSNEATQTGFFDQNARDRRVLTGIGTVDFAIGPRVAMFVEGRYNDRKYSEAVSDVLPERDSSGYEVLGGFDFEVTSFLRGVVGFGYLSQDYDFDVYEDFSGWSADASLEWFPSLLTTVTATLSRDVGDSGIVGAGGYLSTVAAVRVDHELLRNLVLQGEVARSRFEYEDIDRDDRRWFFRAGATYLLNRNYGARLQLVREDQESKGTVFGQEYKINRVTASLFLRL